MEAISGSGLEALIYRISLSLLYPVLAILSFCFLKLLWHLGEEAGGLRRIGTSSEPRIRQLRDLQPGADGSFAPALSIVAANTAQPVPVRRFARTLADEIQHGNPSTLESRVDHLLRRAEAELGRSVDQLRVLVRVGPCLGLAGTLIPLGPGLLALSGGNLSMLSAQLVISFSTTVVGLVVGGGAYVLGTMRAHMADRIGSDLELICNLVVAQRRDSSMPVEARA